MRTIKVKTEYLGGRVDIDLKEQVEEYIENADLSIGDLIRRAVIEYMKKYPIKEA